MSTEDSSDNYEDYVPVSRSFSQTISDSSVEKFSDVRFSDFSSDSENYFSDSSINSNRCGQKQKMITKGNRKYKYWQFFMRVVS